MSAASLSFLLDESDTVLAYENKGKNSEQTQPGHDPLMSALDNLNRVQQLEIIHGTRKTTCVHSTTHAHRSVTDFLSSLCLLVSGYNDMKSELKDFLQRFAAEGKVSLRLKTDDVM